jgi:hypothetical protein
MKQNIITAAVILAVLFFACDSGDKSSPELPMGNIQISSTPAGAAIYLDNVNTGQVTPFTINDLDTGSYEIRVSKSGYFDDSAVVNVADGLTATPSFTLTLLSTPVGRIFLTSTPAGAAIFLNGSNSGKVTPDSLKNLTPGDHTIKLTLDGYFDSTFTATVTEDQTTNYGVTLSAVPKVPVVIQTIFNDECIQCHSGPSAPRGQDLSENAAYLKIVNVASVEQPALKRIAPGDTTNSYLIRKIQGTPGISFSRMPADGPPYLTTAQIDSIRSWVFNGALPR